MYPDQQTTKTSVLAQPRADTQTLVKPMNSDTEPFPHNLGKSDITEDWIRIFGSYSGSQTDQAPLPSFGKAFENTLSDSVKKQEIPTNPAECSGYVDKRSKTVATIMPGVIRHTSHPDRSLAYYYSYRG